MRIVLMCVAAFAAACGSGARAPASPTPDWMAGYWLSCEGGEVAESWTGAGAGTLIGVTLSQGDQAGFEFLRVAANGRGGFSYFSMPGGRSPATEFVMVSNEGQRAVFENLEHDFPQRIIYERTSNRLHARIEDATGSNGMDWTYRLAAHDERC
jgi:hypothetical protein